MGKHAAEAGSAEAFCQHHSDPGVGILGALSSNEVTDSLDDRVAVGLEEDQRMLRVQAAPNVDQIFAFFFLCCMDHRDGVRVDQCRVTQRTFRCRVGMRGKKHKPVRSGCIVWRLTTEQ